MTPQTPDATGRALVAALVRSAKLLDKRRLYHEGDVVEEAADVLATALDRVQALEHALREAIAFANEQGGADSPDAIEMRARWQKLCPPLTVGKIS